MNESNMVKAGDSTVEQLDAIHVQCIDTVLEMCSLARRDLRLIRTTHQVGAADEEHVAANYLMEVAPELVMELISAAYRIGLNANRLISIHDDIRRQASASTNSPEATAANGPE